MALYLAWRGTGNDEQIWWSSSGDGGRNWHPQRAVPGIGSSHGPVLLPFEGRLYMFWKGTGEDHRIFWSLTTDGNEWTRQREAPPPGSPLGSFGTTETPGAAVFDGRIQLFWKGPFDNSIWHSEATASVGGEGHELNWVGHEPFSSVGPGPRSALNITRNSPAALAMQRLYLAGQRGNDDGIFAWSRGPGEPWYDDQIVDLGGVGTSDGPALAPNNTTFAGSPDKLLMYWKGSGDDHGIWHSTSSDNGASWAEQRPVPNVGTDYRPALVAEGERVYAAWSGVGDDNQIYVGYCSPFEADTDVWLDPVTNNPLNPGERRIPGIGTRHRPALASF